jgi:hypothetical protein
MKRFIILDWCLIAFNVAVILFLLISNQFAFYELLHKPHVRFQDFFVFYCSCGSLVFCSIMNAYTIKQRVDDHCWRASNSAYIAHVWSV